jgi:hypothetical protein
MKPPAIPTRFSLPGGYRVRVRLVTFAKLQEIGRDSINAGDKVYAFFNDENGKGTLYLVRGRHPILLAMDFQHEIDHAWPEWRDWWFRQWGIEEALEKMAEASVEGARLEGEA